MGQKIATNGTAAPASEGSTPYAKYKSVEDSTTDVSGWYTRRKGDFFNLAGADKIPMFAAKLLANGYYGGPSSGYINGVRNFYKDTI